MFTCILPTSNERDMNKGKESEQYDEWCVSKWKENQSEENVPENEMKENE